MQDQLVSFETAKLAKEKKFREECFSFYNGFNELVLMEEDATIGDYNSTKIYISAPSQSFIQKWLRETHKIHLIVDPAEDNSYGIIVGTIQDMEWIYENNEPKYFKTYEEAIESGLQKALKLI